LNAAEVKQNWKKLILLMKRGMEIVEKKFLKESEATGESGVPQQPSQENSSKKKVTKKSKVQIILSESLMLFSAS
jgi:hypothetical protein